MCIRFLGRSRIDRADNRSGRGVSDDQKVGGTSSQRSRLAWNAPLLITATRNPVTPAIRSPLERIRSRSVFVPIIAEAIKKGRALPSTVGF